jgi:predicted Zn-dependent protease
VVLNNLANVLLRQGDATALTCRQAHRLAHRMRQSDTLGWVLVHQGQTDLGLRHLRDARLRDPQDPEIRYHLAAALARAGRKEPAGARAGAEGGTAFLGDGCAALAELSGRWDVCRPALQRRRRALSLWS